VLSYADAYVILVVLFVGIVFLLPWMRRVRVDQTGPKTTRVASDSAEAVSGAAAD